MTTTHGIQERSPVNLTDDEIDRLRKSDEDEWHHDSQLGVEAGRQWAKNLASPEQLRRLSSMDSSAAENGNELAESAYFAIDPDDDGDRQAARDFWGAFADHPGQLSIAFVEGFIDGATDVLIEYEKRT